jgi:hypothetical protein
LLDFGPPTAVGSRELDECFGLEIARSSDDWIATISIANSAPAQCRSPIEAVTTCAWPE